MLTINGREFSRKNIHSTRGRNQNGYPKSGFRVAAVPWKLEKWVEVVEGKMNKAFLHILQKICCIWWFFEIGACQLVQQIWKKWGKMKKILVQLNQVTDFTTKSYLCCRFQRAWCDAAVSNILKFCHVWSNLIDFSLETNKNLDSFLYLTIQCCFVILNYLQNKTITNSRRTYFLLIFFLCFTKWPRCGLMPDRYM